MTTEPLHLPKGPTIILAGGTEKQRQEWYEALCLYAELMHTLPPVTIVNDAEVCMFGL